MRVTPQRFRELLPTICTKETSFDPDGWTPENPLWGHCAIVSLLANDCFGGGFIRSSLDNTPFFGVGSHYWNILPDGTEQDFTKEQFGDVELQLTGKLTKEDGQPLDRGYLLKNQKTEKRYELLRAKFQSQIQQTS